MTTFEIESAANQGNIARDLNVGMILRMKIVPEFLFDVRVCAWRKKNASFSTAAGKRDYALASDMGELREVHRVGYGPLEYIGEDAEKVFAAESAEGNAAPTGYYLGRDPESSGGKFQHLFLNAPADAVHTIRYTYLYRIPFADYVTPVDLSAWIPEQFHWALVEGVKREIFHDKFGINDPRTAQATAEFEGWKARANYNMETAKHGAYVVSAR
jgi:hypothetical protein